MEEIPKCAICSEPAAQVCGGCRSEHYCGRTHQKQAWRAGHRNHCSAFRLDFNEEYGRYMVATRDIKQGEIIFKEKPAILGPKISSFPRCLSCYKRLTAHKDNNGSLEYYKCTKCGWPMCNAKCEADKTHRDECALMAQRKYKSSVKYAGDDKKEAAYCVITPLRCLLLQSTDPKQYEAVLSLEGHLEQRRDTPLYRILKANIVTFIQQVLGLTQFDEDTILKFAAILDTNSFDIGKGDVKLRGVYLTAAMMSHDCVPNAKHVFIDGNYCMAVIAAVPIAKGSTISISYTQPLKGTLERRAHLHNVKCFDCTCKRCSDPTELGIYTGAIFCSRCYDPTKEPKDIPKIISTDPNNNAADWKCESCEHRLQAKQMVWGNDAIRKDITLLNRSNLKAFEEFIVKYERALHPTNSHILDVKLALCKLYGHLPGFEYNDLNDTALKRKVSLCEELADVLNVLQPGMSQARGVILLEMQEAMVIQTKRDLASSKITKEAAQELLAECMTMLKEASEILKSEPEDIQEMLAQRLELISHELE